MPRRQRIHLPGCPQHVLQRGANGQTVFFANENRQHYLDWLREYAEQRAVLVHAYCLMDNHLHLLLTAPSGDALSGLMQDMGRRYAHYINRTLGRAGGVWQGRYKACHLQAEAYLLASMRYIELNPVRANLCHSAADYPWSSFHTNALGEKNRLITPHGEYLRLGSTREERQRAYHRSCLDEVRDDEAAWRLLRDATQQGGLAGDAAFAEGVSRRLGQSLLPRPRGRPRKQPAP